MGRPTRPTDQTRNGDCKVTGIEERNQLQFYAGNPFKNE